MREVLTELGAERRAGSALVGSRHAVLRSLARGLGDGLRQGERQLRRRCRVERCRVDRPSCAHPPPQLESGHPQDRKSTRLNSSHLVISYAVFCLKKKKNKP